jgi:hypothetical protein
MMSLAAAMRKPGSTDTEKLIAAFKGPAGLTTRSG